VGLLTSATLSSGWRVDLDNFFSGVKDATQRKLDNHERLFFSEASVVWRKTFTTFLCTLYRGFTGICVQLPVPINQTPE
jgi:hypothetical protein